MNVDTAEEFTELSLCSGYAGIGLGLKRVISHLRTIAYVERETFAIANLVSKIETGRLDVAPIWTDIKTFPSEEFSGMVDIITGGYPCPPFSFAGKRKGADDPRHLWPYIRRIYKAVKPRYVFFENVEGHVTLGLSTVISDLEEDGYQTTWGIFSAAEVGAPHQRKRVFILGYSRLQRQEIGQKQTTRVEQSSKELAHANSYGRKRDNEMSPAREDDKSGREKRVEEFGIMRASNKTARLSEDETEDKELAHAECIGRGRRDQERAEILGSEEPEIEVEGSGSLANSFSDSCCTLWPSRPGEEQYEREPSRTIEPRLGGDSDGDPRRMDANRIDRLRLCGNGVVPATVAKAWTTLIKRFDMNYM